jgi:hypothetical protein
MVAPPSALALTPGGYWQVPPSGCADVLASEKNDPSGTPRFWANVFQYACVDCLGVGDPEIVASRHPPGFKTAVATADCPLKNVMV